jgi:GT2 family glycosyltransferase
MCWSDTVTRLPTMTVAIASRRRRRQLQALLEGIAAEIEADSCLSEGLDVVVVLDGSVDGSSRMVRRLRFPVPIRVLWQRHQGLATARNAALKAAAGELVWFLDDDLVPAPGLVARHRAAHGGTTKRIVVGPCAIPEDWRVHPTVREFWDERLEFLASHGRIPAFNYFSAANTSGAVTTFLAVGGFDAGFRGYGSEDYELAVRLLQAGADLLFDPKAIAWHRPAWGVISGCLRQFSEGRNQIRLVTAHPETFDEMFPRYPPHRPYTVIRKLRLQRFPNVLAAGALGLIALAAFESKVSDGRRRKMLNWANGTAFVAGVARHDPDGRFVKRVLSLDWPTA